MRDLSDYKLIAPTLVLDIYNYSSITSRTCISTSIINNEEKYEAIVKDTLKTFVAIGMELIFKIKEKFINQGWRRELME
jgi:hypothetical protein